MTLPVGEDRGRAKKRGREKRGKGAKMG